MVGVEGREEEVGEGSPFICILLLMFETYSLLKWSLLERKLDSILNKMYKAHMARIKAHVPFLCNKNMSQSITVPRKRDMEKT